MGPLADVPARRLARAAGALYLVNIVAGAFAIGFVNGRLFTPDPAATASAIQAHELLYRSGLAAHVVVTLTNVPLAVIFYELFKAVDRRLALLDASFVLVATAVEAAGVVHQFTSLALLGGGPSADALPPAQLHALASLPGALAGASYDVSTAFFGMDILVLAYLVLRSGLVPRAIGALLAVDGLAYLVFSATDVLSPDLAAHLTPWIQLPAPVGEGALALWLLLRGVGTGDRAADDDGTLSRRQHRTRWAGGGAAPAGPDRPTPRGRPVAAALRARPARR